MASTTMSADEIADLLDEAAAARELATVVNDPAAIGDLLDYASELEACAAGNMSAPPPYSAWLSERPRRLKASG